MPSIVRSAKEEDYPGVLKLIREFIDERLERVGFGFYEGHLFEKMKQYKDTSFVLEMDGEIAGVLAGTVIPDLPTGQMCYQEIMWFITKEKRSKGVVMLKEIINIIKEAGVHRIVMVALENETLGMLEHIYKRLGFNPLERHYLMEV